MDSKEYGLVVAQQLTGIEDLHYGFWDEKIKPTAFEFINAQKRYSDFVINAIEEQAKGPGSKILDVGCGTGTMLMQLLQKGYHIDGVIPSASLKNKLDTKLQEIESVYRPTIYDCPFENFPSEDCKNQYDVIYFSESFQYIPMDQNFAMIKKLLKPEGKVVICDFFQSEHHGDGGPGDGSMGGGHPVKAFYDLVSQYFKITKDIDITKNTSPTIGLLNEILMERLRPALVSSDVFLSHRNPFLYKIIKFYFRKKIKKLNFKYFTGNRSKETFERYKTYHLLVLENK